MGMYAPWIPGWTESICDSLLSINPCGRLLQSLRLVESIPTIHRLKCACPSVCCFHLHGIIVLKSRVIARTVFRSSPLLSPLFILFLLYMLHVSVFLLLTLSYCFCPRFACRRFKSFVASRGSSSLLYRPLSRSFHWNAVKNSHKLTTLSDLA